MEAPATSPPVPRAAPEPRRWAPPLAVLGVLISVVFGGYMVAAALSEPAGPPVSVAGVVRVSPISGWEVLGVGTLRGFPAAQLTRGSGSLAVVVVPQASDVRAVAETYVRDVLRPEAEAGRLSFSQVEPVALESGLQGVRFSYVGLFGREQAAIEGQVTAVAAPSGAGVVFDGWAPEGLLSYVVGDLDTMIQAAEVH